MKKSIQFSYEAHYSTSHALSGEESELWLVFHGYGQLAEFFIRKFIPFDNANRLVIAPEATNYHYLSGFQGRVGANWMTKHERELAIANNHRYLDGLMETVLSGFRQPPKIHVLGFSQGAATATRWASQWAEDLSSLVLWAGGFAHDMQVMGAREKFLNTKITVVYGNQDEFLNQESLEKQKEWFEKLHKKPEVITFEGGHELNASVLKRIFDK